MKLVELWHHLPLAFTALFVAILFLQSGLDKVFNYRGNLDFLSGHFAKSPLSKGVPVMLPVITLMEVATGALALIGLIYLVGTGSTIVLFYASILGAASLTALFFGQRIAQDYPGAAVLVPYFLLLIVMMYLSGGVR
jgi:hypothetical protein